MKRIWNYGTATPIQRIGVIVLAFGLVSLAAWMIRNDLSFSDLLHSYYLPDSRDSFFFHLFYYLIPIGLLMSWGYQVLIKIKEWIVNDRTEKIESKTTKQRKPYIPPEKNLHFKNNHAAFKFAAQQYSPDMNPMQMSLGLVQEVYQFENGSIQFLVQLADMEKITFVSGINDKYEAEISKGNLVYWGYVDHVDEPNSLQISAIGHILATLSPEFNPNTGKWTVKKDLTK